MGPRHLKSRGGPKWLETDFVGSPGPPENSGGGLALQILLGSCWVRTDVLFKSPMSLETLGTACSQEPPRAPKGDGQPSICATLPKDHILRKTKNLILTPHIGYVSEEAYEKFFDGYIKAIEAFINKNPINQIF